MNKLTALAGASAIYLALGGMASAQTLETLQTTSGWDGATGFGYLGPGSFGSFGQTFTPTATQTTLQDFTYYLQAFSGTSPQAEASSTSGTPAHLVWLVTPCFGRLLFRPQPQM